MSANEWYDTSGAPSTGAALSSSVIRAEFDLINAGFGKLPDLAGNGDKIVVVNAGGTALTVLAAVLALSAAFTLTGGHATTLTTTGVTGVTLPTTGTLSTLAGVESLSNKTFVAPVLGTPASGLLTNCTGTASGLTAGNVTTNANLTGHVTSTGNAAVLGTFTLAQLNTAVSDADVATIAGSETLTSKTLTTPTLNGNIAGTSISSQADLEAASSTALIVTPGRQHFHPSAAKAWISGSTGTTIYASYNVTSITDTGVGDHTFDWTVDFSSSAYVVVATAETAFGGTAATTLICQRESSTASASSAQIMIVRALDGAKTDPSNSWQVAAYGDR